MISVIIATYGESSWETMARERALPSVETQASDIVIGHVPKASIAKVRNRLARKAKGDWLCFLDADDELAPGYIAEMERIAEHVGAESKPLLTPAVRQVINGRHGRPRFYPPVNLLGANWLVVGTVLPKELFKQAQGFGDYPHGFEDWSLWAKCTKLGAHVIKVQRAVYVQHVDPKSKHRQGWRDRNYQVSTHKKVQAELEAWTP